MSLDKHKPKNYRRSWSGGRNLVKNPLPSNEQGAYLAIDRCPIHGYYAVCVGEKNADGSGHGTRLTPSKCCGQWNEVRSWPLTIEMCDSIIYEVEAMKELIARTRRLP